MTRTGDPDPAVEAVSRPPSPRTEPITDSPWFWAAIFGLGALIALYLSMPKFSWRQPQIERQFQARERSGQAVSATGGPKELSQTGRPLISLKPLVTLFAGLLLGTSCWYWLRRWLGHRIRG